MSGCSQPGTPAASSVGSRKAADPAYSASPQRESREGVYIALAPQRDSASMLATSGGRLEVVDDCLVLRSEFTTYLPVFTPSADTFVTDSSVVIAGKAVPLGSEIRTAGGELAVDADSLLERPRPGRCRHRLLRVASWAPATR